MKVKLTLILLLLVFNSFGQRSLAANPKNNFIYNGVYTPIQVMLPICDYDSLSVTASHGVFKKVLNNYYAWKVCESEKVQLFISIKAYQNNQVVYRDKSEFFLEFVPNPRAFLHCGYNHYPAKNISEC